MFLFPKQVTDESTKEDSFDWRSNCAVTVALFVWYKNIVVRGLK